MRALSCLFLRTTYDTKCAVHGFLFRLCLGKATSTIIQALTLVQARPTMTVIFVIFLLSLSTKQTVECNVNWLHPKTNSKGLEESNNFPCDNFNCLVDKFELLKTETGGFLLKEQQTSNSNCHTFDCWIQQFNIEQTSYGFELKLKQPVATEEPRSIFKSIFKSASAPSPSPQAPQAASRQTLDIFQTYKTTEEEESRTNLEEDFYDMFY